MIKHTQGSWRIARRDPAVIENEKTSIAEVWVRGGIEWEANARLIAAAPDLLEMLIEARAELEFMAANERSDRYNNPRINAAIAKATGESA